jgi:hypothetical protein
MSAREERLRLAWQSARERAQAYGEGILQHVADRDTWMGWTKTAEAELSRLRAERHSTNEALDDAVRENAVLRARIAELEAAAKASRTDVLREAADAIVADNDRQLWATKPGKHWAADLLRRMADGKPLRQQEDPHDSDLHHTYALGRDLPTIAHQQDRRSEQ